MEAKEIVFYILSFIILASAVMVVRLKNVFRAGLLLIITFVGVGGIFLLLQSEFLAFIQVLIYVGAVAVLILFAVMLTSKLMEKDVPSFNGQQLISLIFVVILLGISLYCIMNAGWKENQPGPVFSLVDLARVLMGKYLIPFELISVLLLAALMGAVSLAQKEKKNDS